MQSTFAQKDIVDTLGIPTRTFANWCDQEVLIPQKRDEDAGSGVHRRFVESEVDIAAVLHQGARGKLPIGVLRDIAHWFRGIQRVPKTISPVLRFEDRDVIEKLIVDDKLISGHTAARILSWYYYFAARYRPEVGFKVIMRVAPAPRGWDGFIRNAWADDFNFDEVRDGGFDFNWCVEFNLSDAFAKLHPPDEPSFDRLAADELLKGLEGLNSGEKP
jgi:hypothetical protein